MGSMTISLASSHSAYLPFHASSIDEPLTFRVGDAEITRVTERLFTTITPEYLFPEWDPHVLERHRDWLVPDHMDAQHEHVVLSVHTWVIKSRGRVILVDTGIGNDKDRPFSTLFHMLKNPYLERLAKAGVRPEQVDYVLMTHLHVDHVGWNTLKVDGAWVPTFPNARYVFAKAEQEFYATPAGERRLCVYADSVLPLVEAGLTDVIADDGGSYLEDIRFHPTPGHSFRHMAISLHTRGEVALFAGDVMHHPLQVYRPAWNSVFCDTPQQARQSRQWLLDYASREHATVFPAHFAGRSAGTIKRDGEGFGWKFL